MRTRRNPYLCVCLWLAAIGWCGVLFYFSGQSAAISRELSMRFTRFILRLFPSLPYSAATLHPILRKCAHYGIFAVEGLLLASALMVTLRRRFAGSALTMLICAIMAMLNEYHQSFAEGRSCEIRDMLIDAGGALTGILLAALIFFIVLRAIRRRDCPK